jgi:hypothetical protein
MAAVPPTLDDISREDWVKEFQALSATTGEKGFAVRLFSDSFLLVSARGYRPQVHAEVLRIPLQPRLPSGSDDDAVFVPLLRLEDGGTYRIARRESGDIVLVLAWPPLGLELPGRMEFQVATSQAVLGFVTSGVRLQ